MTESLLSKIRARMLELMIVSGLPRAEALKLATKQFGRVELLKSDSGAVPTNPEPTTNDASNAKEQFFARIMSMRSRMFPGAKPEADLSERLLGAETRKGELLRESPPEPVGSPGTSQVGSPLPTFPPPQINAPTTAGRLDAPTPTAGRLGRIARYLIKEDEPAAPSEPKPEERSAEQITADTLSRVYSGHSGHAVNLNQEFPDPVVDNWRRSIEASSPRKLVGEIPAEIVVNPSLLAEYVRTKDQNK